MKRASLKIGITKLRRPYLQRLFYDLSPVLRPALKAGSPCSRQSKHSLYDYYWDFTSMLLQPPKLEKKKGSLQKQATCFPPPLPSCSIALLKRGPSCIWQWQGRGGSCFVVYMAQKCAHNIGPLLLNKPNPQHLEFTTTHRCSYKQEQPMAKRQGTKSWQRHAFYRMLSRVELKKGRSQQI